MYKISIISIPILFYVCQGDLSLGRGVLCASVCVYVLFCVCQDVSSLGNNLGSVCVFCVCVCSVLCEPWLSRCVVFGQQPVVSSLGRGVLCVCMFCSV